MVFHHRSEMENSSSSSELYPPPPYALPKGFEEIKEDQLAILKEYDTVIIVDNSASMGYMGGILWEQTREALSTLAAVASKYDTDGIDICFLNEDEGQLKESFLERISRSFKGKTGRFTSERDVKKLFDKVKPHGPTPLGGCLEKVTHELLRNIEKGKPCKKTNYIVITDGQPTDDAEGAIVQIARRLDNANALLSQLGIQFVQIGRDNDATKFLDTLDNDLREKYNIRDMIDTEPYIDGEVTAGKLAKLLLGGINRKIDR